MKETMTEKEAMRLIKRLEAAGYVKEYDDLDCWEKKFDGYKINLYIFMLGEWHASMKIIARKGTSLSLWLESLKSCRIRDIERMARKMLDYIGGYQKNV